MNNRYIKIIPKTSELFDKNFKNSQYELKEYFGAKRPEYDMIKRGYIKVNYPNSLSDLYSDDGKTIKLKTVEQKYLESLNLEKETFQNLYNKNIFLAKYVYQYKKLLDSLNMDYITNLEEILNKLQSLSIQNTDKIKLCFLVTETFNNIILHLEELGINGARAYTYGNIYKLIKYLPSNIEELCSQG